MPGAMDAGKRVVVDNKKKDKKKSEESMPTILTGTYIFSNGDKYVGEYIQKDGSIERSGTGTHTTVECSVYEGSWTGDKMNGIGRLAHPSGAFYDGEFVNNLFHGKGKYTWANGSYYEGDFAENRLEGKGDFTDTESQMWTGQFRYKAAPGLQFHLRLD